MVNTRIIRNITNKPQNLINLQDEILQIGELYGIALIKNFYLGNNTNGEFVKTVAREKKEFLSLRDLKTYLEQAPHLTLEGFENFFYYKASEPNLFFKVYCEEDLLVPVRIPKIKETVLVPRQIMVGVSKFLHDEKNALTDLHRAYKIYKNCIELDKFSKEETYTLNFKDSNLDESRYGSYTLLIAKAWVIIEAHVVKKLNLKIADEFNKEKTYTCEEWLAKEKRV
jgi:hypothetical protein